MQDDFLNIVFFKKLKEALYIGIPNFDQQIATIYYFSIIFSAIY